MYRIATFSFYKSLKLLLACTLTLLVASFLLTGRHAGAISQVFPRGDYGSGQEWVLLSQYQCPGHCLQTPSADLRLFYKEADLKSDFGGTSNITFTIFVETVCRYAGTPTGSLTIGGQVKSGWPGVTCTGLNSPTVSKAITFNTSQTPLNCINLKYPNWCYIDINFHLNASPGNQPILALDIASNYAKSELTEREDPAPTASIPGTDCYSGAGGTCSKSGGPPISMPALALWNNFNNDGPDTHSNWSLVFKTDCSVTAPQTAYLRWYDADDGGSGNNGTQSGQISFDLIDTTSGTTIYNNRIGLGGNDSYRQLNFPVTPGHTYKWVWQNVSATNGIQIWIPYSENNVNLTATDCTPLADDATCTIALAPPSGWKPNSQIKVTITATNTGTTTWDSTYYMKRVGPTVLNLKNVTGTVLPKKTYQFFDQVTAPGAGGTKTITYRMYNADGPFGTSCSKVISLGQPPPGNGRLVQTGCSTTQAQSVKSSATYTLRQDQDSASQIPGWNCDCFQWNDPQNPGRCTQFHCYRITHPLNNFVDIEFQIHGSDGTTQPWAIRIMGNPTSGISSSVYNTFASFLTPDQLGRVVKMYPHISYWVDLVGTVAGDYPAYGVPFNPYPSHIDGPYQVEPFNTNGDVDRTSICMEVKENKCEIQPKFTPSRPEQGEPATVVYGLTATNQTGRTFLAGSAPIYYVQLQVVQKGSMVFTSPSSGSPPGGDKYNIYHNFTLGSGAQPFIYDTGTDTLYDGSIAGEGPINVALWYSGVLTAHMMFNDGGGPQDISKSLLNNHSEPLPCTATGGHPPDTSFTPYDRPYAKFYGNSITTGGEFADKKANCDAASIIGPSNGGNVNVGGIRTFSYPFAGYLSSPKGSSVDFGALALGIIQGNSTSNGDPPYGFYSDARSVGNPKMLNFANINQPAGVNSLGGYLGGNNPMTRMHCLPDFFESGPKKTKPTFLPGDITINDLNNPPDDQQGVNGQRFYAGNVTINRSTVAASKSTTIFVDGDVYIAGDITYADWSIDANGVPNAPFLTIVARGSILVANNVKTITGLFVAQPSVDSDGIFATCASGFGEVFDPGFTSTSCVNQLRIDGSVIAKHIFPLRSNGTLWKAGGNENPNGNYSNVSEIFNFAPWLIFGTPNLNSDVKNGSNPLEGQFSLPPLF
jgi:hypothetical protein